MKWEKGTDKLPPIGMQVFMRVTNGNNNSYKCALMRIEENIYEREFPKHTFSIPPDKIEWLDEQQDVWIDLKTNNFPLDTPIIIEHKFGYDALRYSGGKWRYWYSGELVADFFLEITLKTARRYIDATIHPITT